jgi:hypothetical protein
MATSMKGSSGSGGASAAQFTVLLTTEIQNAWAVCHSCQTPGQQKYLGRNFKVVTAKKDAEPFQYLIVRIGQLLYSSSADTENKRMYAGVVFALICEITLNQQPQLADSIDGISRVAMKALDYFPKPGITALPQLQSMLETFSRVKEYVVLNDYCSYLNLETDRITREGAFTYTPCEDGKSFLLGTNVALRQALLSSSAAHILFNAHFIPTGTDEAERIGELKKYLLDSDPNICIVAGALLNYTDRQTAVRKHAAASEQLAWFVAKIGKLSHRSFRMVVEMMPEYVDFIMERERITNLMAMQIAANPNDDEVSSKDSRAIRKMCRKFEQGRARHNFVYGLFYAIIKQELNGARKRSQFSSVPQFTKRYLTLEHSLSFTDPGLPMPKTFASLCTLELISRDSPLGKLDEAQGAKDGRKLPDPLAGSEARKDKESAAAMKAPKVFNAPTLKESDACQNEIMQHLNDMRTQGSYVSDWLDKFEDNKKKAAHDRDVYYREAESTLLSLMQEAVTVYGKSEKILDLFKQAKLPQKARVIDSVVAEVKKWYMS